jgi:hypothetical protein
VDYLVILGDDVDAIQKHGFDRILPGPERKREIGEGPKIGVKDKRW